MDTKDLRTILEQTDDKLSIFAKSEILKKYKITIKDFLILIKDFLNDSEKIGLFNYSHFINLKPNIKYRIVNLINDENILLQVLNNDNIINGFKHDQIIDIILKISDNGKKQFLYNQKIIEKFQISNYDIEKIISSISNNFRTELLQDKNLIINSLHLKDYQIVTLVKKLANEADKKKMLHIYEFANYMQVDIIKTFNSNSKLDILLKQDSFSKNDIIIILASLDIETLIKFLKHNKAFYRKKIFVHMKLYVN